MGNHESSCIDLIFVHKKSLVIVAEFYTGMIHSSVVSA